MPGRLLTSYSAKPLSSLRILDLACLEGIYSIELAMQGAEVVGIEGRAANIEKAHFVKRALDLKNLDFFQDDVRNLGVDKYGKFDVVLCAGILYHLDSPDVFLFLEKVFEVTQDFAIIDTHFAEIEATVWEEHRGISYHGAKVLEHAPETSAADRQKQIYASLDNAHSFWFTKPCLMNCLGNIGFTSVTECQYPAVKDYGNRGMFLAKKGNPRSLAFVPPEAAGARNYPNDYRSLVFFPPLPQPARQPMVRRIGRKAKHLAKRFFGRLKHHIPLRTRGGVAQLDALRL